MVFAGEIILILLLFINFGPNCANKEAPNLDRASSPDHSEVCDSSSSRQQHCDSEKKETEESIVNVKEITNNDMADQPTGFEWYSRGSSNEDLINQLVKYRVIKSKKIYKFSGRHTNNHGIRSISIYMNPYGAGYGFWCESPVLDPCQVEEVMRKVDRGDYSPKNAYEDSPQPIGFHATISAPHMHAHALETLKDNLYEGAKVLDVGSGSGYLAACFAEMVGKTGRVTGIEHIDELVDVSLKNVKKHNKDLLDSGVLSLQSGDGRLGYEEGAPYDAIHVGAAAKEVPRALLEQLKVGGKMFIPVGPALNQWLELYEKLPDGRIESKKLYGVRYVPLTSKDQQWPR